MASQHASQVACKTSIGGGGGGFPACMHHRSHDQHPGGGVGGWLPGMHHRSHAQGEEGVWGVGGADPFPAGTRTVGGAYPIGMLPCWNHIYFWLLLFLVVFD